MTIASAQTSKSNLLQVAKVRYSRHYNLATGIGLLVALQAIRRVVKGGAVWLAAPCSQWVWLSRGSTYRSRLRVGGNKRIPKVKLANRLVRRLCYLLLACVSKAYLRNTRHQVFIFAGLFEMFASKTLSKVVPLEFLNVCFAVNYLRLEYTSKKGAFWILEQPASSLLPLYSPLEVWFID